jgi:hypothetical protein
VKPEARAILVVEIKTVIPAAEAVGRKLDEKRRLAPAIVADRLGWQPAVVGAVLVFPESPRLRRLLAGQAHALARMFPVESRRVGSWLSEPRAAFAATWFLSGATVRGTRRVASRHRVPRGSRTATASVVVSVDMAPDQPPRRILR